MSEFIHDLAGPVSQDEATFWRRWRYWLIHAQAGYWLAQGLLLLIAVGSAFVLWFGGIISMDSISRATLLAQLLSDPIILVVSTHCIVRPLLKFYFSGGRRKLRHWFGLGALLALLGAIGSAVRYLLARSASADGAITSISTMSMGTETVVQLSMLSVLSLGAANLFAIYVLWVMLYLGIKALQDRFQLQARLREARVRQLTLQLSPHFLFNAFNTIRGMIFEDQQRAAQLLTQLSELFRFHLSHELQTEQSLADEWRLAQHYLDVEAVRLESRLRLQGELAPECLGKRLPSLTLLTLVENAIKHGIAPNVEGGELRIRARAESPGWSLQVVNSVGRGRAAHSSGTGLKNLLERVALTLGSKARLRVLERDGEFSVRLESPE